MNRKKAFTLVELIVVIAIIATLAVLVISNYLSSVGKGRDARRKSDIVNTQKAIEFFYEDTGRYPNALELVGGQRLCHPNGCPTQTYMQKIPVDPSGQQYTYCRNTTSFQIYARLENRADPQIIQNPNTSICTPPCFVAPGDSYCFGVSSPDISP